MKPYQISNAAAGNPERVASIQPRVGVAAPTLGKHTKRPTLKELKKIGLQTNLSPWPNPWQK
jgi:hypothetical protein